MRLSALQRFILRECYQYRKPRVPRALFMTFYRQRPSNAMIETITKSLERMIDRGLLIGFGRRTPAKWFIDDVRLTTMGRRVAKQALGQQQILPLQN